MKIKLLCGCIIKNGTKQKWDKEKKENIMHNYSVEK